MRTAPERIPQPVSARRGRWPWGVLAAAACAFAVLVGLGTWQVQRLQWKEALIAAAEHRVHAAPVSPPARADWATLDAPALAALDFTPVTLTGQFLPGEALVYTVISEAHGPYSGPGWWVVRPFALSSGGVVLVNRGFVPDSRRDPNSRPGSEAPAGTVSLTGLIRPPEAGNAFTPAADPAHNMWFTRDPRLIGPALGIAAGDLAPFTVDAAAGLTPPSGLPQAGETRLSFPNNHLNYALTWFGLAAALLGVTGVFVWRRVKGAA